MYLFCAAWLDLDLPVCNYGQKTGIVLTDQQVNLWNFTFSVLVSYSF